MALMDKYGIDMQVLTQTTPALIGFNTEEAAEGVKAFQEKRKPQFEDYRKVAI